METNLIRKILESHLDSKEDYIYGFADLANLLDDSFGEFRYGISIGKI